MDQNDTHVDPRRLRGSTSVAAFAGIAGAVLGGVISLVGNSILEEHRRDLSTKREQLENFYAPLEVLTQLNKIEFDRYFSDNATPADRQYIETHVWYPNNTKIQSIVLQNAHLLDTPPDSLVLKMLQHINVWLSEYDLIYVKNEKSPPVFAGPKGHPWPEGVDEHISKRAAELRRALRE